jgi:hypothetical protein
MLYSAYSRILKKTRQERIYMKRIQVPHLTRLAPHWANEEMIKHNDGYFVRWVEVRMLLSILVGLGIIEVKDSEFEVGAVDITEVEDDLNDNLEDLKSELERLQKENEHLSNNVYGQFRKLRKIRVLAETDPELEGLETGTKMILSAFADKILKILDSKPPTFPSGGSGASDCQEESE